MPTTSSWALAGVRQLSRRPAMNPASADSSTFPPLNSLLASNLYSVFSGASEKTEASQSSRSAISLSFLLHSATNDIKPRQQTCYCSYALMLLWRFPAGRRVPTEVSCPSPSSSSCEKTPPLARGAATARVQRCNVIQITTIRQEQGKEAEECSRELAKRGKKAKKSGGLVWRPPQPA